MIFEISSFIAINLVFMILLFYYLKSKPDKKIRIISQIYIENNLSGYLKTCCAFASLYFTIFIIYSNSGIDCKDLDKSAHCACYALEAKHAWTSKGEMEWAKKGVEECPESDWFPKFIKDNKLEE
jgi:hypothetical protein